MTSRRRILTALGTTSSIVLAGCIGGDDEENDNGEIENGENDDEMEDADIEERAITTVERFYQNLDETNTEEVNNYIQEIDHENIISEVNESDISDFENVGINIQNIEIEEIREHSIIINSELELTDGANEKALEQTLSVSIEEDGGLGVIRVRHENLFELKDLRPTDSRGVPRPTFELDNPTTIEGEPVFGLVDLVFFEDINDPGGFNAVFTHSKEFDSSGSRQSVQGSDIEVTINVGDETFDMVDSSSLNQTEPIGPNLGEIDNIITFLPEDMWEAIRGGGILSQVFEQEFSAQQLELLKEQRFTVESARIIDPQPSLSGEPFADEWRAAKVDSQLHNSEMYDERRIHD